jgi:hypothetical protein
MATFTFPYLTLIITTLATAVGLAVLVVFAKALRDTKSHSDASYETTK